jgi:hypothetical protein
MNEGTRNLSAERQDEMMPNQNFKVQWHRGRWWWWTMTAASPNPLFFTLLLCFSSLYFIYDMTRRTTARAGERSTRKKKEICEVAAMVTV